MSTIQFQTRGHCAVIVIDRPEARNAVNAEVAEGIEAAIDALEQSDGLRIGVLTGTPPAFCAGADLKAIGAGRAAELSTERGGFAGLVRRERDKPLIAAVDGPALAGGMELVLACDLVVASASAIFGLPEVQRGLIAAAGGLFRLPRRIPANLAMEHALTGEPFDAQVAHFHGLVNRLCSAGKAVEEALDLADTIANNAPLAVRSSRRVMLASEDRDEQQAWARSDAASQRLLVSEDVQEGVRAFIERRTPSWTGR